MRRPSVTPPALEESQYVEGTEDAETRAVKAAVGAGIDGIVATGDALVRVIWKRETDDTGDGGGAWCE